MLRDQKGDVRRHQRQRDLDAGITRPTAQAQADPADADAVGDFADDNERKLSGGLREREQAGRDRRDGKAVKDQGRGVVGETFPIEHDNEPPRQTETADDGERSDRVGRRHNGAEHEADRPRHAEHKMRHRRHRGAGENDTTEREQRDRAQIETKFAPAHGDARRIDQRRQDAEQHKFRRELNPRQAGNERQRDAGNDKENGRRRVEPPRDERHDHQHGKEQQYRFDRRRHGSHDAAGVGAVKRPSFLVTAGLTRRSIPQSSQCNPRVADMRPLIYFRRLVVWSARAPRQTAHKKLCGSTSMSSLMPPFAFGASASQSRR